MSPPSRDADPAAGIDVALLGVLAFGVVQLVRTVAAAPGSTPALLRLTPGGAASPTAPELGLLSPGGPAGAPLDPAVVTAEPVWAALSLAALLVAVAGPLWYWVGRPRWFPTRP